MLVDDAWPCRIAEELQGLHLIARKILGIHATLFGEISALIKRFAEIITLYT